MIELSHIYKTYPGPVHALRDINLKIEAGEFVYLTGPSGAGKSTLFRMISAFDVMTSGKAQVAGFDLATMTKNKVAEYRRRIGVVFQDFKLLKNRTVAENISLPLILRNENAHHVHTKVLEMAERTGLADKLDQFPDVLSGGEQQRVAIARALIHKPGLLIADEPTGNLDPQRSEEIIDLFEKACAQGTTVVVATHDHALVGRRHKRTLQLHSGLLNEVSL